MKYSNFFIFSLIVISRILYSMDSPDPFLASVESGPYPVAVLGVEASNEVEAAAYTLPPEVVINIAALQQPVHNSESDDSDDEIGPALVPEEMISNRRCDVPCVVVYGSMLTLGGGVFLAGVILMALGKF